MNQKPMIDFRFCQQQDVNSVCDLLRSSNLPYKDFDLNKIKVILAIDDDDIIGSIGVELYPPNALLRSFVLRPQYRGKSIGNNMFQYLMSYGSQKGIRDIHLLTDTADSYFISHGFIVANRNDAPSQIRQTSEFKDLCPSTCTYMVKRDIQDEAKLFHRNLHHWITDKETNARFWAIDGENLSFTFFEVPPFKTFLDHQHLSEQVTHVLKGVLFFELGGNISCVGPGDSIAIPPNISHKVWTEELAVKAVDAWAPANDMYSAD